MLSQTSKATARREYILSVAGSPDKVDVWIDVFGFKHTWATLTESEERQLYDFAKRQEARDGK